MSFTVGYLPVVPTAVFYSSVRASTRFLRFRHNYATMNVPVFCILFCLDLVDVVVQAV